MRKNVTSGHSRDAEQDPFIPSTPQPRRPSSTERSLSEGAHARRSAKRPTRSLSAGSAAAGRARRASLGGSSFVPSSPASRSLRSSCAPWDILLQSNTRLVFTRKIVSLRVKFAGTKLLEAYRAYCESRRLGPLLPPPSEDDIAAPLHTSTQLDRYKAALSLALEFSLYGNDNPVTKRYRSSVLAKHSAYDNVNDLDAIPLFDPRTPAQPFALLTLTAACLPCRAPDRPLGSLSVTPQETHISAAATATTEGAQPRGSAGAAAMWPRPPPLPSLTAPIIDEFSPLLTPPRNKRAKTCLPGTLAYPPSPPKFDVEVTDGRSPLREQSSNILRTPDRAQQAFMKSQGDAARSARQTLSGSGLSVADCVLATPPSGQEGQKVTRTTAPRRQQSTALSPPKSHHTPLVEMRSGSPRLDGDDLMIDIVLGNETARQSSRTGYDLLSKSSGGSVVWHQLHKRELRITLVLLPADPAVAALAAVPQIPLVHLKRGYEAEITHLFQLDRRLQQAVLERHKLMEPTTAAEAAAVATGEDTTGIPLPQATPAGQLTDMLSNVLFASPYMSKRRDHRTTQHSIPLVAFEEDSTSSHNISVLRSVHLLRSMAFLFSSGSGGEGENSSSDVGPDFLMGARGGGIALERRFSSDWSLSSLTGLPRCTSPSNVSAHAAVDTFMSRQLDLELDDALWSLN